MKRRKKILSTILSVIVLFFLFLVWYKYEYSMEITESYQVLSSQLARKLLIAKQGSDFKNIVTQAIVDYYRSDSIYIKVIDISLLSGVKPSEYNAILAMHTRENWKPPESVKSFLVRTKSAKDKIVISTTSGEGTYKIENVDAITAESKLQDARVFVEMLIQRLDRDAHSKT